jgi:hypothetical protein
MREVTIRLVAGNDERSFFQSQELSSDIARLPGIVSRAPLSAPHEPSKKGDPITLGAIAIAAISSGGALTALVATIGSYLSRDSRTEIEIQAADGRKVRISSQTFKREELEEMLRTLLDLTKN